MKFEKFRMRVFPLVVFAALSLGPTAHGEGLFFFIPSVLRLLTAPIHPHIVDFLVGPLGTVYPVPIGAIGPVPVVNRNGRETGVAFVNGKNPKVCIIRIMKRTPARGRSPGYPNGYVKYENENNEGVDPYTGKSLANKYSHFSIE